MMSSDTQLHGWELFFRELSSFLETCRRHAGIANRQLTDGVLPIMFLLVPLQTTFSPAFTSTLITKDGKSCSKSRLEGHQKEHGGKGTIWGEAGERRALSAAPAAQLSFPHHPW